MPSLGFIVFKEKILNGTKRQTIRKYTEADKKRKKNRFRYGVPLYLYWHLRQKDCEFLREETSKKALLLRWKDFKNDEEIAKMDGFDDARHMRWWFNMKHSPSDGDLFWIIRW